MQSIRGKDIHKKWKFDDKSPIFPPKRLLFTEVIHRLCPSCEKNEGHSLSNSDFEPCYDDFISCKADLKSCRRPKITQAIFHIFQTFIQIFSVESYFYICFI